jgi:two-component system, sensor histidine kinase
MVERGQFKLKFIQFKVRTEIEELFNILGPQAKIFNNTFKLIFEQEFPEEVVSDKNRMQQVLLNLLVNSNKFT